jgi:hypothetical protein
MGSRINAQSFELLARSSPLRILLRHRDQLSGIEAILFGQAGLLDPSFTDVYPKELLQTYLFFRDKYSLKPLEKGTWKFLRLRPSSFPTIRISQYADLICKHGGFQESLHANLPATGWIEMLGATASTYWSSHYMFDRKSACRVKRLGDENINLLIINGIVPYLFFYGTEKRVNQYSERALSLLEAISGEKNAVMRSWSQLGMPTDHALYTQALNQLKHDYCDRKRCLDCRIGARLLR